MYVADQYHVLHVNLLGTDGGYSRRNHILSDSLTASTIDNGSNDNT
jgi:hypothetical protein